MVKIELPENRRLQVGPTGSVVLVSCGEGEEANIITVGMYMPISARPPLVCSTAKIQPPVDREDWRICSKFAFH